MPRPGKSLIEERAHRDRIRPVRSVRRVEAQRACLRLEQLVRLEQRLVERVHVVDRRQHAAVAAEIPIRAVGGVRLRRASSRRPRRCDSRAPGASGRIAAAGSRCSGGRADRGCCRARIRRTCVRSPARSRRRGARSRCWSTAHPCRAQSSADARTRPSRVGRASSARSRRRAQWESRRRASRAARA